MGTLWIMLKLMNCDMCCWIVMNSCLNEVVVEFDMLWLLICTMGIPFCEVVVWIGEVCVELSCEGPEWIIDV